MKGFLKMFFASLLAIVIFSLLVFLIFIVIISAAVNTRETIRVDHKTVLVLDLNKALHEQSSFSPLNAILRRGNVSAPGLHDITAAIRRAAGDDRVKGIFIESDGDPNGFATNEEIWRALLDFKKSGKFIYAYGTVIPQKAYYVASVAGKIFLNPVGILDFSGFSVQFMFFKGTLDKLNINPQVFFEGKYKSATEPFRVTQMTPANKLQTKAYLGDLYQHFLEGVGKSRHIDTGSLFQFANDGMIRTAYDALKYGLVDGLKYDDEVKEAIRDKAGIPADDKIPFMSVEKYAKANPPALNSSGDQIAVLYAQGDIVSSGNRSSGGPQIAADQYVPLIRKLRKDSSIKAIIFRVNSPGGSALAADAIWRELLLAKQVKPVVVSMGDYAASGGYYISCEADSIFTEPNTLTGSIGVFSIIPDLQSFFKNKLGITFDGVKTAQYADMGSMAQPLTAVEKQFIQDGIDSVYATFKHKVAMGRHLPEPVVDSLAQGRVWSGIRAVKLGLADKLGGLKEAVACAARMAHLKTYSLTTYPKEEAAFQKLFRQFSDDAHAKILKEQLGNNYSLYMDIKRMTTSDGEILARLPFNMIIH
jgi:protease-4